MTDFFGVVLGAVRTLVAVLAARKTRQQHDIATTAPVRKGQRELRREVRSDVATLRAVVEKGSRAADGRRPLTSAQPEYEMFLGWLDDRDRFTEQNVPTALSEALVPLTSWWTAQTAYRMALHDGDPTEIVHRATELRAKGSNADACLRKIVDVLNALDKQP